MIRPATRIDFPAIDAFDPFAGDRVREIEENRMLVVEVADRVVGYISWLPAGFVGRDYITFLCVESSCRRQRLALRLLRAAEAAIGAGRLFVSTEDDNIAMLALLPIEGWTYAGAVAAANEDDRAEVFFYKDRFGSAELVET